VDDPVFPKAPDRAGMSRFYMTGDEYAKSIRQTFDEEKRAVEKPGLGVNQ